MYWPVSDMIYKSCGSTLPFSPPLPLAKGRVESCEFSQSFLKFCALIRQYIESNFALKSGQNIDKLVVYAEQRSE